MGYFTHQDRNDKKILMRVILFFFSLLLIFLGLFGKTLLPDSIESAFNIFKSLTRGLMVIVGLILLILTINPNAIPGRVSLSKKF
jgi:nitrate reductase gamma subunit